MLDFLPCCKSADADVVDTSKEKGAEEDAVPEQSQDAAATTKKDEGGSADEKPQPMIFAIMRNSHEVIRDAVADVKKAVEAGDKDAAKEAWGNLKKFCDMHHKMEEGNDNDETPKGFFRVLDERCEKIATKDGLFDQHKELEGLEAKFVEEMEKDSTDGLKGAFEAFETANEAHLKKEEGVMMPKVQEMKKGGAPMKKIMREDILALVWDSEDDFQFFVEFSVRTLGKREKNQTVKVFTHALWAVASKEQWEKWNEWVKSAASEELYKEMEPLFVAKE